jgi:hypothetical protein
MIDRENQGSFPDVLDPTFQRIFDAEYDDLVDRLPVLFSLSGDLPTVPRWRRLWWKVCRPFGWLRDRLVDWLVSL